MQIAIKNMNCEGKYKGAYKYAILFKHMSAVCGLLSSTKAAVHNEQFWEKMA